MLLNGLHCFAGHTLPGDEAQGHARTAQLSLTSRRCLPAAQFRVQAYTLDYRWS